jgi:2-keto-4-pentenoate hydratase/2-oxohepta-3-ene-1,7-dioic acid hydratase in catechol pathway
VKIICVGRNYAEHAAELGDDPPKEPLLFGKFENTLIGDGDAIVLPPEATHVDAEAELAVEIGRRGRRITEADALAHVRGYRVANDLSARNLQYSDSQWTRAKGFDTFCPVGKPHVASVTVDQLSALEVVTRVNGTQRQHGKSSDMAFSIPFLLSYISHIMTLEPGDLIATGTPAGVGKLGEDDIVEVEIVGFSMVTNPVAAPSV